LACQSRPLNPLARGFNAKARKDAKRDINGGPTMCGHICPAGLANQISFLCASAPLRLCVKSIFGSRVLVRKAVE